MKEPQNNPVESCLFRAIFVKDILNRHHVTRLCISIAEFFHILFIAYFETAYVITAVIRPKLKCACVTLNKISQHVMCLISYTKATISKVSESCRDLKFAFWEFFRGHHIVSSMSSCYTVQLVITNMLYLHHWLSWKLGFKLRKLQEQWNQQIAYCLSRPEFAVLRSERYDKFLSYFTTPGVHHRIAINPNEYGFNL